MKVAGAVFIGIAVLIVGWFWLVPRQISTLGTSLRCGVPIANVSKSTVSDVDPALVAYCEEENQQQVVSGLVLGLIALVTGLMMLGSAERAERRRLVASGAVVPERNRSVGRRIGRYVLMSAAVFVIGVALAVALASLCCSGAANPTTSACRATRSELCPSGSTGRSAESWHWVRSLRR